MATLRSVAATLGRIVAFVALFAGLQFVGIVLLADPLVWLVGRTGQRIRIDELLVLAAALSATVIMLRRVDVRPWRDVGLGRDAWRPAIVWRGWILGFVAIGVASATLLALGSLQVVPSEPGSSLAAAARITIFLVPAALAEEVLCRGYLLTVIRDRIGTIGAIVSTSLVFGLLHVSNPGWTVASVGIVALAGIFLAAVRIAYRSLYAAWAAHVAWNWVMAVPLHAPVSGLRFESPDYRTVSEGPAWLTGGAWGPEGGVAAVLGMLACLYYLYARRRREES
ncbi:MAG: CPBP family intramembrane glutamic endopeptidase [Gemmatimonadaceae bacterium]